MTMKKNKKSESVIMLLKIFEVYGGFKHERVHSSLHLHQ